MSAAGSGRRRSRSGGKQAPAHLSWLSHRLLRQTSYFNLVPVGCFFVPRRVCLKAEKSLSSLGAKPKVTD